MKNIWARLIVIFGFICGLYIGGWMMFIQPVIQACHAFDAGTLTATLVGITVLKCIFASTVGAVIVAVCCWLAGVVQTMGGHAR